MGKLSNDQPLGGQYSLMAIHVISSDLAREVLEEIVEIGGFDEYITTMEEGKTLPTSYTGKPIGVAFWRLANGMVTVMSGVVVIDLTHTPGVFTMNARFIKYDEHSWETPQKPCVQLAQEMLEQALEYFKALAEEEAEAE